MKRVAAMTVIRGEGECEAYKRWIVNEELKKMNERYESEMEKLRAELKVVKGSRNNLRDDRMAHIKASEAKPVQFHVRVKNALEDVWCLLWAMCNEIILWVKDDGNY